MIVILINKLMSLYRFLTKINPEDLCLLPIHLSPNVVKNIPYAISGWNCNTMDVQGISLFILKDEKVKEVNHR